MVKFGKVGLQICQNFLRKMSKKIFDLNALLSLKRIFFALKLLEFGLCGS